VKAMILCEALQKWASIHPTIDKLYVFGSRAKGTARADSDLDLAFDFTGVDEPLAELIDNAARWKAELADLTGIVVTDLYLSTDRAAQGPRQLIFSRESLGP
jgi:predicted nucleotidyltransferase